MKTLSRDGKCTILLFVHKLTVLRSSNKILFSNISCRIKSDDIILTMYVYTCIVYIYFTYINKLYVTLSVRVQFKFKHCFFFNSFVRIRPRILFRIKLFFMKTNKKKKWKNKQTQHTPLDENVLHSEIALFYYPFRNAD